MATGPVTIATGTWRHGLHQRPALSVCAEGWGWGWGGGEGVGGGGNYPRARNSFVLTQEISLLTQFPYALHDLVEPSS